MKFHELKAATSKKRKRAGRGIAAGRGKTAGRGTKGQNSRSGGGVRPGFEGGQNPLYKRIPKQKGFRSRRTPATVVYTGQLNELSVKIITNAALAKAGLIENEFEAVKVIAKGEITAKLDVQLQNASESAMKAIEKTGGTFTETATPLKKKVAKQTTEAKK